MSLNAIIVGHLTNLQISGLQGKAYCGDGVEPGNGSQSSVIYMKCNKNGHIVMYNTSWLTLSNLYGGITYVPISILSYYEKL